MFLKKQLLVLLLTQLISKIGFVTGVTERAKSNDQTKLCHDKRLEIYLAKMISFLFGADLR